MPTDDLEADLLRRFQALKSTPTAPPVDSGPASFKQISDQQAKKAQEEDEELERIADGRLPAEDGQGRGGDNAEMEFARRMARLRGVEMEVGEDGDQEVNDFIASLSSNPGAVPPSTKNLRDEAQDTRESDTRNLEKEAQDALKASSGYIDNRKGQGDEFNEEEEEEEEAEAEDFETEDEILLRALEEAELEAETRSRNPEKRSAEEEDVAYEKETEQDILARARALATSQAQSQAQQSGLSGVETVDAPRLSFPSLPTHTPMDESQDAVDTEAEARMALLLGLSGPSTKPGPPRLPSPPTGRKPGQGWNLPGYKDDRDEDPDSWCCICNKDADVVCLGCDDDPYCEECWIEGHVGERHRTKRYAGKGGREAIGA